MTRHKITAFHPKIEILLQPISSTNAIAYLDQIVAIDQQCFERELNYPRNYWYALLQQHNFILAKDGEKIIGLLVYFRDRQRNALHVSSLAIHPNYQGKSVGSSLMKTLSQQYPKDTIELECRPSNEPFYRRLGYKPICLSQNNNQDNYYLLNYYQYGKNKVQKVHGLFMQKKPDSLIKNKKPVPGISLNPEDSNYEDYRQDLLALTVKVALSTSVAYGGWIADCFGRSKRKEKALEVVRCELAAIANEDTKMRKLNPAQVLQTLAHNTMLIRGFGIFSSHTTSGEALVDLLNTKKFKRIKSLIKPGEEALTYEELKAITELTDQEKTCATQAPFSPYRHF